MFKEITRKWTFWSAFILLSLCCGIIGSKYLFKALPILSIDLTMTKQDALAQAATIAQNNQWQPHAYNQAVHFDDDSMAQFFAELECGGIDSFKKMIEEKLYAPYKWRVRHFKENITHETTLFFTPEGTPYGFTIKLPDTELSENLTVSQARDLAVQKAEKEWNVSFEQFTEIEASKDTKQNGRVDHCFVYEHTSKTLGLEGKYRIKLIVCGNQFCTLSQYVQIPESFIRKYQEMRSVNTLLHTAFSTIFNVLYLLLGGLLGGFLLIRQRRFLLKPLLIALCGITALSILDGFNKLPLQWISYNTAMAQSTFASTYVLQIVFVALLHFVVFFLAIGSAEGFDRKAFPDHLQFWKVWSKKIGGSLNILGQTITGYCLFGINLLLMTCTYYLFTRVLGWWTPVSTLMDPNIIATPLPWLSAFAPSVSAGFWEEWGARALPLAGAVLLGNYFGKKRLFLIIGFIVQALIFGGLHASYVQQPAYFRIVELIAPSFIWAGIYIAFGLLPSIICHYLWDLMWFALPIMVCQASEMFIQKCIIILLGLVPFLIVLYRRYQVGSWSYADNTARNSAWEPTPEEVISHDTVQKVTLTKFSSKTVYILVIAGVLGTGALFFFNKRAQSYSTLIISRQQALQTAQEAFKTIAHSERNWIPLTNACIQEPIEKPENKIKFFAHPFIWRTQRDSYTALRGSYLADSHWVVRFASFDGDIAARAEEYFFFIDGTKGAVTRIKQVLPENATGATLSQAEARGIALAAVEGYFGLLPEQLKEISAIDLKRPARKDWQFIFQDITKQLAANGQARICITLAGDTVVDYERSIFVPEEWARTETERVTTFSVFTMVNMLLLLALFVIALGSFGSTILSNFNTRRTLTVVFCLLVLSAVSVFLQLPSVYFSFSTAQSFSSQYTTLLLAFIGSIVMFSFLTAPLLAHIKLLTNDRQISNGTVTIVLSGIGITLATLGLHALVREYLPSLSATPTDLTYINSDAPLITLLVVSITTFLRLVGVSILFSEWLTRMTAGWTRNSLVGIVSILIIGNSLATFIFAETIFGGLLLGTLLGLCLVAAHYYILHYDARIMVASVGTVFVIKLLKEAALKGFSGSWYVYSCAALCIALLTLVIIKKLTSKK